jgi:hypothetical protein
MNDSYEFEVICKNLIVDYVNEHFDQTDGTQPIDITNVYVVWMCKTLKNSKALLSTTVPDGKYYEMTYNGEKDELYMDVYTKVQNICVPNSEFKKTVTIPEENCEIPCACEVESEEEIEYEVII